MRRVGLVMHEGSMLYEVALAAEVFGVDRHDLSPNGNWYLLTALTADGAPHPWLSGTRSRAYAAMTRMDLIIVTATADPAGPAAPELIAALQRAHRRGVPIAALCTGAFILGEAGLLDGRPAATHWWHAGELSARHPTIDVRDDVLYVDDGDILTSAGKTAALDLCIQLVRRDFGEAAARGVARRLVAPAVRTGSQAQFTTSPAAAQDPGRLHATLEWARVRIDQPLTVVDLARHARLSTRQLSRVMDTALRTSPLA